MAGLVVPDSRTFLKVKVGVRIPYCIRPLGLQIELIVLVGKRPPGGRQSWLVILDGSRPPGLQVVLVFPVGSNLSRMEAEFSLPGGFRSLVAPGGSRPSGIQA